MPDQVIPICNYGFLKILVFEFVDYETASEFRLKPCGLGRHNITGIGDIDELVHGYGVEGESHLHFTAVNSALQFTEATDTAYEVDSLVATEVSDSEDVTENEVAGYCHVKHADRILIIVCTLFSGE